MAVDEVLLEEADRKGSAGEPTLRLYGWNPATLSLGRNQRPGEGFDAGFLNEHGIDLVRRPTGGLSVLHDDERTFSVSGSLEVPPFDGGVVETYKRLGRALRDALELLGVAASDGGPGQDVDPRKPRSPVCFEGRTHHEIVVGQRKLIGVAQVRRRRAFLQHGSIPLTFTRSALAGAVGHPTSLQGCVGLREIRPDITAADLNEALRSAFERRFDVRLLPGQLSNEERSRVEELRTQKYESSSWNRLGKMPSAT